MNRRSQCIVAGIDVGGLRKGFHAVALEGAKVLDTFRSADAARIAQWCEHARATVIGVDAPIHWRRTDLARLAERELAEAGISCFFTPTEALAREHPTDYYAWMRNGASLYQALGDSFHLFDGRMDRRPICFETFPHATACALAGEIVSAKDKRVVRRALLADAGVTCDALTNIDLIDATLCALAADYFARRRCRIFGDPVGGYIVVPCGK